MQCELISGEIVLPIRPQLRAVSHTSKCSVTFSLPHIYLIYATYSWCLLLCALVSRCQFNFHNHILVSDREGRQELHTARLEINNF
jgi:hypothetical protein